IASEKAESKNRAQYWKDLKTKLNLDFEEEDAEMLRRAGLSSRQAAIAATAEKIDEGANEAATSPINDKPEPTQEEAEAGEYEKGPITVQGMNISIENPKGSVRSGTDPSGKKWSVEMKYHYGYHDRTKGKDGDEIDVFVGEDPDSQKVFIVDQVDPETGEFDETKSMLAFKNKITARKAYLSNYEKDWKGLGAITEVPIDEYREWVGDGQRKTEAYSDKLKPKAEAADIYKPPKESKTRTLRGRINEMGGINPLNFKGEVKDLPLAARYLFKKSGYQIDLAEEQLKDEGWLHPDEDLLELLRTDKQAVRRNKVTAEGVEKPLSQLTDAEKRFKEEMEYEPEEPPPGEYVLMKAQDLPEGKTLTIIDGSSAEGWDTYEITEKDPFGITLKDGTTIELSPLDDVQVLKSDLGEKPDVDAKEKPADIDAELEAAIEEDIDDILDDVFGEEEEPKPTLAEAEIMEKGWKRIPGSGGFTSPYGEYVISGKPGDYRVADEKHGYVIGGTYTNVVTAAKAANNHWLDSGHATAAQKQPDLVTVKPKLFEEPAVPEKVKKPPKEKLLASDKVERQETAKLKQDDLFGPKQQGLGFEPPTAKDLAKKAGIETVKSVKDAVKGLSELFGPKNTLTSGLVFDEDTYAKAKPFFDSAWEHAKEAGFTLKELAIYIKDQTSDAIRPYLKRFLMDAKAPAQQEEGAGKPGASDKVATWVQDKINNGFSFTWRELFKKSDEAFGGTQAEGAYTPKDAYDAMELGVNRYLLKNLEFAAPDGKKHSPEALIERLGDLIERLPTQTKRTEEMDKFQQFSTPPALACAANWVANIGKTDTYLEPSAG
ncbi:MAG: hypothetical protein ABIJ26_05935, partial [Candidatus Margulisiibacteriota bacterium]